MPLYRVQMSVALDSPLPRDKIVNTFFLREAGGIITSPQNLANDAVGVWQALFGNGKEIRAKVYNNDENPGPPVATSVVNVDAAPAAPGPREVALCLSFRGEQNTPSTRGRLYICPAAMGTVPQGGRPGTAIREQILTLGMGIANLGGADVDWVVYSPTKGTDVPVKASWVDDEWDTIRSRGMRPTGRTSQTHNE